MKTLAFLSSALMLAACGCDPTSSGSSCGGDCSPKTNASAAAVVCGMTAVNPSAYGGWAGTCPGADVDAATFTTMCRQFDVPCVKLLNAECTFSNIVARARAAVETVKDRDDALLILFFSGHGGQVAGTKDEADGLDETICLWDGQLRDDYVWQLLETVPSNVRVWMVTDCCNSGTNFRKPHSYVASLRRRSAEIKKRQMAAAIKGLKPRGEPNLLHWGGCGDGESSYGGSDGGVFTTALVDSFDKDQTYRGWFKAAYDKSSRSQHPTVEETGTSFQDRPIFR